MVEVLLIAGVAGSGKSTLSWEVGAELERRGLAHAMIDTDELDRVWPLSLGDDRRRKLNVANLASWWNQYEALGITRLVLVGVFLDVSSASQWISEAIPCAAIRPVRLSVSEQELRRRIARREVGSGGDAQLERSLQQLAWLRESTPAVEEVDGEAATMRELAERLCDLMAWSPSATR